jgi:hypothetical protein
MNCPSPEALKQYLSACSDDGAGTAGHVLSCERCQSILDEMSDSPELRRWLPHALALPAKRAEDPSLIRALINLNSTRSG